jgi:hypothetical protein
MTAANPAANANPAVVAAPPGRVTVDELRRTTAAGLVNTDCGP